MAATGSEIGTAMEAFAQSAFGSAYSVGTSLNRAVALGLVGLGFIIAERANLINVGGDGQIAMGGIFATAIALYGGVKDLLFGLAVLLPVLLAGAAWGALAVRKARRRQRMISASALPRAPRSAFALVGTSPGSAAATRSRHAGIGGDEISEQSGGEFGRIVGHTGI